MPAGQLIITLVATYENTDARRPVNHEIRHVSLVVCPANVSAFIISELTI